MITVGLTGSIATGKTEVAKLFAAAGIPVFDSDAEVRFTPGKPPPNCWAELFRVWSLTAKLTASAWGKRSWDLRKI